MTEETEGKVVYTIRRVARQLNVTEGTVRRWIKEGRIEARKFGRGYRVAPEEMARVLAEGI